MNVNANVAEENSELTKRWLMRYNERFFEVHCTHMKIYKKDIILCMQIMTLQHGSV